MAPVILPFEFYPESWRTVLSIDPLVPILVQARHWFIDSNAPTFAELTGPPHPGFNRRTDLPLRNRSLVFQPRGPERRRGSLARLSRAGGVRCVRHGARHFGVSVKPGLAQFDDHGPKGRRPPPAARWHPSAANLLGFPSAMSLEARAKGEGPPGS